jgi:hypothetical protein
MLWLAPSFVLVAVISHVALVPAHEPGVSASPEAQERSAAAVREKEPELRRKALERFPGDPWSQGDDFGNGERELVRKLGTDEGVRPGAVLDAIDRDVKAFPGNGERGAVAPCMPRPFYD